MDACDYQNLRKLFDDYLQMYSSRDDRLTSYFSEDFSGFTGGGDTLVKDRKEWVAITRQDFTQVKDSIEIKLKDLSIQSLATTVAVATSFFTIHLPIQDQILSNETARLVLIFNKEATGWKISHSSISIPYHLVRDGEIYPLKELVERNRLLEEEIAEQTVQLSETTDKLQATKDEMLREIDKRKLLDKKLRENELNFRTLADSGQALVWMADTDKLCYYFNKVWLDFTGRTYEQEYGNGWADGVHPEDLQRCLDIYIAAFDKREPFCMVYRLCRFDGEYRWILDDGCPRYNSKREFIGYIGHCLDITEQKLAEDALREKVDELIRFQNLTVDRELTMIELKKEVNELLLNSGKAEKYRIIE